MWDNGGAEYSGAQSNTMTDALPSGCTPVGGAFALGSTDPMDENDAARFWAKVDKRGPDECWEWQGPRGGRGYGRVIQDGRSRVATRVMWELVNGKPWPEGMLACHRCDNPPCVNPAHIFVGSYSDNALDAMAKGRQAAPPWAHVTHCSQGHAMTPENTYLHRYNDRGGYHRQCRICKAARRRSYYVRKEEPLTPRRRVRPGAHVTLQAALDAQATGDTGTGGASE